MPFLASDRFRSMLAPKFSHATPQREGLEECFETVSEWLDTAIYANVLSSLDQVDYDKFMRFFTSQARLHFNKKIIGLRDIIGNAKMQVVCIACMQYYFC